MEWIINHWMDICLALFFLLSAGQVLSKFTKTDKDDKFFARAKEALVNAIPGLGRRTPFLPWIVLAIALAGADPARAVVENVHYRAEYSGNGSVTSFSYDWKITTDSDLKVYVRAVDGAETLQILDDDYTVTGAGDDEGGAVVFTEAPVSGETVIIIPGIPLTQSTEYAATGPIPASSLEQNFDRLTLQVQRLQEQVDRALLFTPGSPSAGEGYRMGEPSADAYLLWDSAGENVTTTASLTSTKTVADIDNIEDYGDSLTTLVATVGSANKAVLIHKAIAPAANVEVGANITLIVTSEGRINPEAGVTVTLDKLPQAGDYQIFNADKAGYGDIAFGTAAGGDAWGSWWGMTAGDGEDDDEALQAAVDATEGTAVGLQVSSGAYDFSTGVTADGGEISIKGLGITNTVVFQTDDDITLLTIAGDGDYSRIENISFISASDTGTGLKLYDVYKATLRNLYFLDWSVGLHLQAYDEGCWYNAVHDSTFSSNDTGVLVNEDTGYSLRANRNHFTSCLFTSNASYGAKVDNADTVFFLKCDWGGDQPVMVYSSWSNTSLFDCCLEGSAADTNEYAQVTGGGFTFIGGTISHGVWNLTYVGKTSMLLPGNDDQLYTNRELVFQADDLTTYVTKWQRHDDTVARFAIESSGDHEWGNGTDARDTHLVRSAEKTLYADTTSFDVGNDLRARDWIGSNQQSATISSGAVTLTGSVTAITPESGTSDTLSTIAVSAEIDSAIKFVWLRSTTGNTITLDESDNIRLRSAGCVLDSTQDVFFGYIISGPYVHEIDCSDNG